MQQVIAMALDAHSSSSSRRSVRGQAALDFLMTYGWALLLIAIAAAAIVSLGILDVGSFMGSRAVGFSQVVPTGWQLQSGTLSLKLKNDAGTDINVTSITASYNVQPPATNTSVITILDGDVSNTIPLSPFQLGVQSGASYSMTININYTDTESGFEYVDSGTITGRST
jgi:hypothetical protein